MSYRPTMEELSAYLEGDLEGEAHEKVREAVAADPELQASLKSIEVSLQFLRKNALLEAPPDLREAVMASVVQESVKVRFWWARATTGAVVLAAAAATLFVVLPSSQEANQRLEKTRTAPSGLTDIRQEAGEGANTLNADVSKPSEASKKTIQNRELSHMAPRATSKPDAGANPPSPYQDKDAKTKSGEGKVGQSVKLPLFEEEDEESLSGLMTGGAADLIGTPSTAKGAGGLSARGSSSGGSSLSAEGLATKEAAASRAAFGSNKGALGPEQDRSPTLITELVSIDGSLDRSLIDKVVNNHQKANLACLQRSIPKNPTPNGKITINFVISEDGSVRSVEVKASTLGDAAVEQCLVEGFLKMEFPQTKDNSVVIAQYSLEFAPG